MKVALRSADAVDRVQTRVGDRKFILHNSLV